MTFNSKNSTHSGYLFPILRYAFKRSPLAGLIVLIFLISACSGITKNQPSAVFAPSAAPLPLPGDVYQLRIGDVIQVDVFQEPLMTTRQRVLGNGTIHVPLLGRIEVAGESIERASAKIATLLNAKHLVSPQVNITVLAYMTRRFTVWGQVKAPGVYVIPPEGVVSLPEAIAMAGGNTLIGNPKKVIVSRRRGATIEQIKMNALDPRSQSFFLEEGDIVLVKETIF